MVGEGGGGDSKVGEGGRARARAAVGEGGERACAVVGEGGGRDGEVGGGERAGEHTLVRRWVRVVGEMARWADMRARACTREGG